MSNSRVTNAEIAKKLDILRDDIGKYRIAQEKRIVYLETCLPMMKKQLEGVENDVDNLKKRDYIVGGATGILATIATILGANK